jgi:hypothetical protein
VIGVHAGDTVELVGDAWTDDCFDTGATGACERGPGDERPARGIDVDLVQADGVVVRVVEDVAAEPDLTLSVSFQVPDVNPGGYRVIVHDRGLEAQAYPELWIRIKGAPTDA